MGAALSLGKAAATEINTMAAAHFMSRGLTKNQGSDKKNFARSRQ
jgi:hypothetical protein